MKKAPEKKSPTTVMLAALGPSKYELHEAMIQHDFVAPWDELWTVNTGLALFPQAQRCFIMDDVYDYASRHPAYGARMRHYSGEIIGQTTLPNDGNVPFTDYPLAEVLEFWGGSAHNWIHTISIGYVLAYAGYLGIKHLMLAGVDCSWPNRPDLSEAGHGIVCYWIGRLESIGCKVDINSQSTLNHTHLHNRYEWRRFYGYLRQPMVEVG